MSTITMSFILVSGCQKLAEVQEGTAASTAHSKATHHGGNKTKWTLQSIKSWWSMETWEGEKCPRPNRATPGLLILLLEIIHLPVSRTHDAHLLLLVGHGCRVCLWGEVCPLSGSYVSSLMSVLWYFLSLWNQLHAKGQHSTFNSDLSLQHSLPRDLPSSNLQLLTLFIIYYWFTPEKLNVGWLSVGELKMLF